MSKRLPKYTRRDGLTFTGQGNKLWVYTDTTRPAVSEEFIPEFVTHGNIRRIANNWSW